MSSVWVLVVAGGWWLAVGEGAAYLGAVSWVVYNSCLGFLRGGRRHFTMQGGDDGGGAAGKMPDNTNVFHDHKHTEQMHVRAHTHTHKRKQTSYERLWSIGEYIDDCRWFPFTSTVATMGPESPIWTKTANTRHMLNTWPPSRAMTEEESARGRCHVHISWTFFNSALQHLSESYSF